MLLPPILLGFFTDRSQVAIDRVGVHGPRIVALGKISQKRYEILEVGVVKRVGQSTAFG